ncbi:MAG: DNA polymerase III subunit delta' [Sutterellaceae bacterium]|nr:DNA polymerase III subunit delta' [Burkholderiaceae bacterium]MCX7901934.1 DNA polymerase III subunit delta' [Burkholderiaceae bacterium]MDW8431039.1 DNA polymerase III subunit delta' [Sutterellaceae bacterium]
MDFSVELLRNLPWHAAHWHELQALRARHAHAILLHGPAGVGKKGLALDLAAAVLCEAPVEEGRACGRCAGCILTARRNHPDLRIVVPDRLAWLRPEDIDVDREEELPTRGTEEASGRPSGEISIDDVRALVALLDLTTHRGGYRVVVLTPAEAMTAEAANALLKMLEEPPPRTLFILTSDQLDEVLPTVISRCMLVRVGLPPQAVALPWLRAHGVEDAAQALAEVGGAPLLALPRTHLPAQVRRLLRAALASGARLDAVTVGAQLPRTVVVAEVICLFLRWAWDLLALRFGGSVRYHLNERDALVRLARQWSTASLLEWIDLLLRARASAEHSLNARLTVEALLLEYVRRLRADNLGVAT